MKSDEPKFERGKAKMFTFKRVIASAINSVNGLKYAYTNEQSMSLHGVGTIFAIAMSIFLKINFNEWTFILLASVFVLSIELLNTSVEAIVDLITDEYHDLAKIAKDCGSAATFVSTLSYVIICAYIFIPKLWVMIR